MPDFSIDRMNHDLIFTYPVNDCLVSVVNNTFDRIWKNIKSVLIWLWKNRRNVVLSILMTWYLSCPSAQNSACSVHEWCEPNAPKKHEKFLIRAYRIFRGGLSPLNPLLEHEQILPKIWPSASICLTLSDNVIMVSFHRSVLTQYIKNIKRKKKSYKEKWGFPPSQKNCVESH